MQKPLLEKTSEETLKGLFSQAGFNLQKIKDYTNQIDKEVTIYIYSDNFLQNLDPKSPKIQEFQGFQQEEVTKFDFFIYFLIKRDEIVNNITKTVLEIKQIMIKIDETETNSVYLSDLKVKNQLKLKENLDLELDRYGNIMKQISEMKMNEKLKQSRLSLSKSNLNLSESQLSNDEEALQTEERIKQMQVVNLEEEILKERDEDIKEIGK